MVKNKKKIIGTLAPIFSLTSNHQSPQDQGTFETGTYFLDWLKKTNQHAWQILPFNETQLEKGSATKHVPSPYKGYGIGLSPRYLSSKFASLKPDIQTKNTFIAQHKEWLEDYALFCSIRDAYGTDDWREWDERLSRREKAALKEWAVKYKTQINYYIVQQWQLNESYSELHEKAKSLDIALIGDIPYYLSVQSPLVWANQKAFQLNKDGSMSHVSGIPDTAGTVFGRQLWGHPLYNWENKELVIDLWKMRLRYQALLFDDVRFDHAKAFFSYGVMVPENKAEDRYHEGPGKEVMRTFVEYAKSKGLIIFAEDSGDKIKELRDNMREIGVPGIRIYSFAFKPKEHIVNHNYAVVSEYAAESVAYTTTHDTLTLMGYLQALDPDHKKMLSEVTGITYHSEDRELALTIRNAVIRSPSQMVIIPIQDWLLTTDRINTPGTEKEINDENWHYKVSLPVEELPVNV